MNQNIFLKSLAAATVVGATLFITSISFAENTSLLVKDKSGLVKEVVSYDNSSFSKSLKAKVYCGYKYLFSDTYCAYLLNNNTQPVANNNNSVPAIDYTGINNQIQNAVKEQISNIQIPVNNTIPSTNNTGTTIVQPKQVVYQVIERAVPGPVGPQGPAGRDGVNGTNGVSGSSYASPSFYSNYTTGGQYYGTANSGATGATGATGAQGATGTSITSVAVSGSNFIITYSTGATSSVPVPNSGNFTQVNTNGLLATGTSDLSNIVNNTLTSASATIANLTLNPIASGTTSNPILVRDPITGQVLQIDPASLVASNTTNSVSFDGSNISSTVNGVTSTTSLNNLNITSATSTNLFSSILSVITGYIDSLFFTNATGTNLAITNITGTNATFTNLSVNGPIVSPTVTSGDLVATNSATLATTTINGSLTTSGTNTLGGQTIANNLTSASATIASLKLDPIATGTNSNPLLVRDPITGEVKQISASDLLASNTTNNINYTADANNSLVSTVNGVVSTTTIGTLNNLSLTGSTTAQDLNVSGNTQVNNITGNNATFTNLSTTGNNNFGATTTFTGTVDLTNATVTGLNLANATITNLVNANATSTNFFATVLNAITGYIDSLFFTNATGTNITATGTANLANIINNTLTSNTATITDLTVDGTLTLNPTPTSTTSANTVLTIDPITGEVKQISVANINILTYLQNNATASGTISYINEAGATTTIDLTTLPNLTITGTTTLNNVTANSINTNNITGTNATFTNLSVPNTLSSTGNTLTSNIAGSQSTSTIINSNTLSTSGTDLVSNVNGVTSTTSLVGVLASGTTNTASFSSGVLTTTVNGVIATTSISGLVSSTTNTLTYASNTNSFVSNVNGIISTSTIDTLTGINLAGTTTSENIQNSGSILSNLMSAVYGYFTNLFFTNATGTNIATSNLTATGTSNLSNIISNNATITNANISNLTLNVASGTSGPILIQNPITGAVEKVSPSDLIASNTTHTIGYSTTTEILTSTVNGITATTTIQTADNQLLYYDEYNTAPTVQPVASGLNSVAIGDSSVASGDYSSSFGRSNTAAGVGSSAFGYFSSAYGLQGSAFGTGNTSRGDVSNAFGNANTASATAANAIGFLNTATGIYTAAVGTQNTASGEGSNAIGRVNTASGQFSQAFGYTNTATNLNSLSFGSLNTSSNTNSTAFGFQNTSSGLYSNSFGGNNLTSNTNSSAFGSENISSGVDGSAFGRSNNAAGTYSSAFGYSNIATGTYSTAFGTLNKAGGGTQEAMAFGSTNISYGSAAGTFGYSNKALSDYSYAFGDQNSSSGYGAITAGHGNTVTGDASGAFGYGNVSNAVEAFTFGEFNTNTVNTTAVFGRGINTTFGYWNTNPLSADSVAFGTALGGVYVNTIGNVGIGNTTANNKLEITKGIADQSGLRFTNLTSASTVSASNGKTLSVDSNGDVILVSAGSASIPADLSLQTLVVSSTTAPKVATFNGDIDVTGTIDPTRILFTNLAGVNSPTYNPSANGNAYAIQFAEGGDLNFGSDTTGNILHLKNNGNVGIGTASPAATTKLHVSASAPGVNTDSIFENVSTALGSSARTITKSGATQLINQAYSTGESYVVSNNSTIQYVGTAGSAPLSLITNNSTRVYVTPDGDTGIGTTIPTARLHVTSTTSSTQAFKVTDNLNYTLRAGYQENLVGYFGGDLNTSLALGSNNLERMRIDSNGNVGIGTTTPSNKLTVEAASNPLRLIGLQTGATSDEILTTDASGVVRKLSTTTLASSILNSTGSKVATFNGDIDVTGTIDPTRILFTNLAGVNSPTYNPSANGNAYAIQFAEGGDLNFGSDTTGNILHLKNNGNVGIGTTSPAHTLTLNDVGDTTLGLYSSSIPANATMDAIVSNAIGGSFQSYLAKIQLQRGTSLGQGWNFGITDDITGAYSEAMRVAHTGSVGINTQYPTEKLTVNGRITAIGTGYVTNPDGPVFGRYSTQLGYLQTPGTGSGKIEIWDQGTNPIAEFFASTTLLGSKVSISGGGAITNSKFSVKGNAAFGTNYNTLAAPTDGMIIEGNVGIGTSTPVAKLDIYSGSALINAGIGINNASGYSVAMGVDLTNTALYSQVFGQGNTNSGARSIVAGNANSNTAQYAAIFGVTNTNTANGSLVYGSNNNSNGIYSLIGGITNTNSGSYSFMNGSNSSNSGNYSLTSGDVLSNSGTASAVIGASATSTSNYSFTTGRHNVNRSYGSTYVGIFAEDAVSAVGNTTSLTNPMFVVGNGSSIASRRNAMTVLYNGNVGVGTSTPNYKFEVQGDINAIGNVRANGVILTSDERFKTNVKDVSGSEMLDKFMNINPVSYNWNELGQQQGGSATETQVGFIAQDVEEQFPEFVSTRVDGYKGVNYIGFIPVLVAMVQTMIETVSKMADEIVTKVVKTELLCVGSECLNEEQIRQIKNNSGVSTTPVPAPVPTTSWTTDPATTTATTTDPIVETSTTTEPTAPAPETSTTTEPVVEPIVETPTPEASTTTEPVVEPVVEPVATTTTE